VYEAHQPHSLPSISSFESYFLMLKENIWLALGFSEGKLR
jgi:hypothetical protein